MPLVVIAELSPPADACAAVARLKANPATQHIPVLGFARAPQAAAQTQARELTFACRLSSEISARGG